jgi:hypothetical protein
MTLFLNGDDDISRVSATLATESAGAALVVTA